jgi:RimJ/RimL family protein N-acetyltransferase
VIVPSEIRTARLLLRPWRADDAPVLLPILEANREHLGPWIPARVAEPAPIPVLGERLAGFADDFVANREWRYGMFSIDDDKMLGEVGLVPRSPAGRVQFDDADRVEVGYWVRADETGRGYVTEAARAVLDVVSAIPQFTRIEIRCDARNGPSGSVAQRLGFALASTILEPGTPATPEVQLQLWTMRIGFRHSSTTSV